jgi:hypothetical protein
VWRISAQPGHSDYLRAGAHPATADVTRFINTHRDRFGVESICHTLQCRMPCVCWPAGPRPAPTTSSSLRSSTTPSRLRRSRRPTDQVNLDEPPRGTAPRPCSAQRAPHEPGTPGDSAGAVLRSGLHLRRHAGHRLTWPMSDAFTGVRAVATPTVAESMRMVTPQDHATYAPVYGDTLAADYRRQPVWPGAAIRG